MLGIHHDSTCTVIIYGMANLVLHVAHDMNCHITKDSAKTYRDWDILTCRAIKNYYVDISSLLTYTLLWLGHLILGIKTKVELKIILDENR